MYDLTTASWADNWADELSRGVPLPRLVWPTEVVGEISGAGAERSGLPAGVPVVAGTIDAWAEARSVGVRNPGDMMLMYGSTLFIVAMTASAIVHPRLWATAGISQGSNCLAAGMATAGALTEWVRELAGGVSFEHLVEEASKVPPGANGLLTLPYFAGERSPLFDPRARGMIAGLTLSHGRPEIARSVYEAIAFGIRHNLEAISDAGARPDRIIAVGGGARSAFWPQVVSDVTGVEQILPVRSAGASYGDALMAGIGVGILGSDSDWMVPRETIAPSPTNQGIYDRLYRLYRELYHRTTGISHELAELQS
jgi:xylulokinase